MQTVGHVDDWVAVTEETVLTCKLEASKLGQADDPAF